MERKMIKVCLNQAFVSGIIPASDTRDVAAGIRDVCEVPVTHDKLGNSGGELMPNNPPQRIPLNIKDSGHSSRKIILLGKSGVGKSAAGNMILGEKEFTSILSMDSVTTECTEAHATVSGRSVSVVDTPGFFDTKMKPEKLITEIAQSVYLSSPGPHAFLIVFPVNMRYTDQEQQIPQQIEMLFGQEVLKYSIVLFTHGDQLKGKSVVNLIESNHRLKHLVDQCGGRYQVFFNEDENNREQVNDLLQKIDKMIEQNGGAHYSNQMYEDAQRFRQEEEEQRQREEEERKQEEEKQRQEEIESVRKETEERVKAEIEAQQIKVRAERKHKRKLINLQKQIREKTENEKKEASNGFLLFLSKYKHHICTAAIAAGFVVGGAVGGAAVYGAVGGAIGGGVAGSVVGGAETGTVTGAAVGAFGGAAVGAAVGGAVVGGAAAATVGAVAKAVGVGVVGGAAVGGAVGGASSGTVKGAVKGALAGAVVGGAAVGGAAASAALSGAVGAAAVGGAVAGGAVGGAAVGGVNGRSVAGAVEGGVAVGGAVLAGAALGKAFTEESFNGELVGVNGTYEFVRTVVALSVVNELYDNNDRNNKNNYFN